MFRRIKTGLSLRAKVLGILAGGALFATIAVFVLVLVARQSDLLLERTSIAQRHLELLILLSGRISDYDIVLNEAARSQPLALQRLEGSREQVEAAFHSIENVTSEQVGGSPLGDAQTAAATTSLINARMKALFAALHGRLVAELEKHSDADGRSEQARAIMNAFGIQFSPQLAQAAEDQRSKVRAARREMSQLRRQATVFAVIWAFAALSLAALLYWFAGRPILSRIAETVEGAGVISSGHLKQRLKPSGRDELTLLMTKFNRMADSFERRETRLLEMQNDLQQIIAERTSDLSRANTKLEEIDHYRRRFFSDISHELRTPLTVVIGEAEVNLRQKEALDETVATSFTTILNRARNLRRRVDDLLRVARSESGKLDLERDAINLNGVISEAVEENARLSLTHQIDLHTELPSAKAIILGDPEWLRQAISGLIANAIKYSPAMTRICAGLELAKDQARITISDQGAGISQDDLPFIFDRFYKGKDENDARAGGFGIGLALIKWVVEEHGGAIEVISPVHEDRQVVPGPGSAFTITLPLIGD